MCITQRRSYTCISESLNETEKEFCLLSQNTSMEANIHLQFSFRHSISRSFSLLSFYTTRKKSCTNDWSGCNACWLNTSTNCKLTWKFFYFSGSILLFCGHEMNVKNNFARFQSFCVTVDLLTIHLQWFYNSAEYLKLEAWSEIWFPFNSPVGCVLPRK